jgi:pimeloyl-ACP methyl ester carboxylesterase
MDRSLNDGHERWAEVRADGRSIRYRSRGSGRPLLALAPSNGHESLATAWIDGLSARFRVIAPDTRGLDGDVATWLGCFLEGLGTRDLGVLAAGPFRGPALELALAEPERIARVVLVGGETTRRSEDGRAPVPVLELLEAGEEPGPLLSRIAAFLEAETLSPPA